MAENEAGVRELKTHLSAYLRRVREGETITITDRGDPVGRIVPIEESLEDRLKALADAGVIDWNGKPLPRRSPVAKNRGDRLVSDIVSEDRR